MSARIAQASLDDRYELSPDKVPQERILISGTQALVRLTLMQKARDRRAGLNTAGFVTGYRGSPLGGVDAQFLRARRVLEASDIRFRSGLNEELAATSLWGTQQAELRGEGRFDGVFGIWYGKGPGVDRAGDVFRHANFAGTSRHGGVLALMGDDHTAESSTTAHQSDFHFVDVMMPILNPAGVQEILDLGLYGFALSRFAGSWVAVKGVKDTMESTAVVDGRLERVSIVIPDGVRMPDGGLNIRLSDNPLQQEARLQEFKRDAMLAFVRANKLNRWITSGGRTPKMGIATLGKSYLDVRLALDELGIDEVRANHLGIRLYKIACPWPLAKLELMEFAHDLDMIMVVEEKRSLVEVQVREELYGTAHQPIVVGKKDERGDWLFPVKGALEPTDIAVAIGRRLLGYVSDEQLSTRVAQLEEAQRAMAQAADIAVRTPHFCSGCPHNTSTKVPDGMRAYAGIGCHYMVQWMDRATLGFTQMGGEGANWVGEAPFSKRRHVFQNLGDGTYSHSGSLAIRAAIAAGVNVTYKILFNDAVAMTGGQRLDGGLTASKIARQVAAEGVARIKVVSNEPWKYGKDDAWPAGCTIHPREALDEVQRELAAIPGVTVLIYDQTCAAEKRRRRKRGQFPDPATRVIINDLVCEGCGDCGVKSNCISIQPLETEFGRKRQIDQSSCNKDFSCIKGLCPSFVTVSGGKLKARPTAPIASNALPELPEPQRPAIHGTYNVLVSGIGGTGIVTIAQVLGMAAHLDGKACGLIDMAGLAQKGGAVFSHLRLAERPEDIHAIRIGARSADLVLAGDLVVAGNRKVLAAMRKGRSRAIVNTHQMLPGDFTRNADFSLPDERLKRALLSAAGPEATQFLDASAIAEALFGNSVGSNIFLVGVAFQMGSVPLSADAIERAIVLNGEAVEMNLAAFRWGRRAANDPSSVTGLAAPASTSGSQRLSETLDEMIARRVEFLADYQDAAYAARYRALVDKVRAAEAARVPGSTKLSEAVARYAFKLMAYKDEYEVARLYADGRFAAEVADRFEGKVRLSFHLAPTFLARRDKASGEPRKISFGPWLMTAFRLLARMKGLRGTPFDPFGWTAERRNERALVEDYFALMAEIVDHLSPDTHALAVGLAAIPEKIRGYGPVKARHLAAAKAEEAALLAQMRSAAPALRQAAE